jgi:GNAT superfamily N-acetyltransferase
VDDADAIGSVHVRAWQAAYRGQLPDDHLDGMSIPERQASWRTGLPDPARTSTVLVVEDPADGHVCGFTTVGPLRPDGSGDLDPAVAGQLYAINLEPEAWGRGIGTPLLHAASDELAAQGYGLAILWTLRTNARARRFYEREGWRADGAEHLETWEGVELDEVRYRRSLDPPGQE